MAKKQLYLSICSPNIQGVKEALARDSGIVNEKMRLFHRSRPLELAVREIESEKVQLEICSQLIKAGADVNHRGIDNNTDLCWALDNERFALAKKLIESGADVNQKGDEGTTPLKSNLKGISIKNHEENEEMLDRLLDTGAVPDSELLTDFLKNTNWGVHYYFAPKIMDLMPKSKISEALSAAISGNNKKLQQLVRLDKIKKSEKQKVLALAAAYCNVDTLKLMKKQGYDFLWKDEDKVGLIHVAALCNQTTVVEYLLEQGLSGSDKVDFYKADAVAYAVLGGRLDNAKLLIEKDNVDYRKNRANGDCSAWTFVSQFGDERSFETLQQLGFQPTEAELYHAYEDCSDGQFEFLIKIKDSIYVKEDKYGDEYGILSSFVNEEFGEHFVKLCDMGLRASEDELKTLIWTGRSDTVKKVLENKMTKGRICKEALLQSAIDIGDFPMVKYLVEQGADVNRYVKDETEDFSWTSMNTAYGRASRDIVDYLKQKGGDTQKKDSDKRTCRDIAKDADAIWNLE